MTDRSSATASHVASPFRLALRRVGRAADLLGAVATAPIGCARVAAAALRARRLLAARGGPRPFRPRELNLLILGATPLADVRAKGNWSDTLCRAYFNPGEFFKTSTVLIFPGRARINEELPCAVRYVELPFPWTGRCRFTRGAWAYASYLIRILRLVAGRPVDLIRAQDPHLQGLAGILVQALVRIPSVVYIVAYWEWIFAHHGEEPVFGLRWRWLRLRLSGYVYRHLAGTFSAVPKDPTFVSYGIPPDRIHLFRQEIELAQFAPLTASDQEALFPAGAPPRPWILYVGRLHPEKHSADLLEAMARGGPAAAGGTLLLCGDGPERPALGRRAAELGLGPRCLFLGFQPNALVARLMVSADVILCPLSGSVLAEAAASGTPIVAYNVDWHRTLIQDGETGLLVPYRDTAAMGAAVDRLVGDPALARRLGEAARAMAVQEYSMERIEGLMVDALRKSYEAFFRRLRGATWPLEETG